MKASYFTLSIVFLSVAATSGQVTTQLLRDSIASIEVDVRDESLIQVPNIEVIAVYPQSTDEFAKYRFVKMRSFTRKNGRTGFSERTILNPSIGVQAANHYASGREVELNVNEGGQKEGRWLPSPFVEQLIVKRIVNPVPMYAAANLEIVFPKSEGAVGFDLEIRDWVGPHGTGVKSDLLFEQEKKIDNVLGSTAMLRISFSNPSDGLVPLYELQGAESELALPRTAPTRGYQPERRLTTDWDPTRQHTPPTKPALGYIYRVRTVLDEKGRVKSAWYGKIHGEFEWDPRNYPTGQVTFTYYLNPDGTTNLEFDRKKNLFPNLPPENSTLRP